MLAASISMVSEKPDQVVLHSKNRYEKPAVLFEVCNAKLELE